MALDHAGWIVYAVCPGGHPLSRMNAVHRDYSYQGLTPLKSFAGAIAAARPDFIIPGDDRATSHLHHLYERERQRGQSGHRVCELIERSLGAAESFPMVYARTAFIDVARQEGIRAPKTEVVEDLGDVRKWVARFGLSTVLKANG